MPTTQPTTSDAPSPDDPPADIVDDDPTVVTTDESVAEEPEVTEVLPATDADEDEAEPTPTEVLAAADAEDDDSSDGEPEADEATAAPATLRSRLMVAVPLVLVLVVGFVVIGVVSSGSDSGGGGTSAGNQPGHAGDPAAAGAAGDAGVEAPGAAPAGGETGSGAAPVEAPPISVDESLPADTGEGGGGAAAPSIVALGAPAPARTGSYQLSVSVDDEESSGTYVVSNGDGGSQVHRVDLDGGSSEQRLSWGADGVSVVATTSPSLGTCNWSPPARLAPADIAVGSTWNSTSDCTVTMSGAEVAVHQSTDTSVVNRGTTQVGDEYVEVLVLSRRETQTRTNGGITVTSEVATSELYAPQLGLVIERQSRASAPRPDGSVQSMVIVERIASLP